MLLALMWHFAGNGRGEKDMVVLPYKDRLVLFSKYLQQLVMESLGKELDLDGNKVNQGIAVYGNKGSTDQHAYVQQLRDGVHNFFVTFIEVRQRPRRRVDRGGARRRRRAISCKDFCAARARRFTKAAATRSPSSLPQVTPYTVGALIALYERAVGFYASLVNINAYHQPGVEAGKKAAAGVLNCSSRSRKVRDSPAQSADGAANRGSALGEDAEAVYHALESSRGERRRRCRRTAGVRPPADDTFALTDAQCVSNPASDDRKTCAVSSASRRWCGISRTTSATA